MLDEVNDAALVLEGDLLLFARTLIFENDLKTFVEEGHGLEALHDGASHKLHAFRGENGGVWIEGDRCAGLSTAGWGFASAGEFLLQLATVGKFHGVALATTIDF